MLLSTIVVKIASIKKGDPPFRTAFGIMIDNLEGQVKKIMGKEPPRGILECISVDSF